MYARGRILETIQYHFYVATGDRRKYRFTQTGISRLPQVVCGCPLDLSKFTKHNIMNPWLRANKFIFLAISSSNGFCFSAQKSSLAKILHIRTQHPKHTSLKKEIWDWLEVSKALLIIRKSTLHQERKTNRFWQGTSLFWCKTVQINIRFDQISRSI